MVNPRRGETGISVAGTILPMRLTLGALAELEAAFAVDSLPELGDRFARGKLSAKDVTRILAAGLRGAGQPLSDADVAGLAFDDGLSGAIHAAIKLLEVTFAAAPEPAGAKATAKRPPVPPRV
ncbi:MAG: gene transfer agent family protein [Bosea sp. (in: a-proteobacteria)]